MKHQMPGDVSGTLPIRPPAEDAGTEGMGEPIAIVGNACRFPQADSLEAFWRLLDGGVNAVVEGFRAPVSGASARCFPTTRHAARPAASGHLFDDIDRFERIVLPDLSG